uniref:PI-4KBETA1 (PHOSPHATIDYLINOSITOL 4-OH KINASE BETA1) n=1 Tax=Arundo donax TaxID=35708 RepID=A0A0A9DV59_ARUDO
MDNAPEHNFSIAAKPVMKLYFHYTPWPRLQIRYLINIPGVGSIELNIPPCFPQSFAAQV